MALLSQYIGALVMPPLSSLSRYDNQLDYVIASPTARYSSSHVEVTIETLFRRTPTGCRIVKPNKAHRISMKYVQTISIVRLRVSCHTNF
jgi:hypothetical protein